MPSKQEFDSRFTSGYGPLVALADDPNTVNIIGQSTRLGVQLFVVKLEYEHFPPRSPRNKLYNFTFVKWPEPENGWPELLWFVVSIPKEDYATAEQVAAEVGLKIKDGVPVMMDHQGDHVFPISGPNCFALESNPQSKIYENDPAVLKRLRDGEMAECQKIINGDEQKLIAEFEQKGYNRQQIERILKKWYDGDQNYMEKPESASTGG